MSERKGIYWLASYPKSGNTWFRLFLSRLLDNTNNPLDLNKINTGTIASARQFIDQALGFDSSDLDHDEIDQLRPAIYTWHADQSPGVRYNKIHDAYTFLPDGTPMIPDRGSLGALYFIRNPLDVAISYANHLNCSIDQAIAHLRDPSHAFCKQRSRQNNQLRQHLLSWSDHVRSWTQTASIPCLVIRYEDMKANPAVTFHQAVQFLQLESSAERIAQAIAETSIERLQQLEKISGFSEKPAKSKLFFRKGIAGDWKNTLTQQQINQIIQDHDDTMRTFGYL
jgi:hypothetical protein